MHGERRSAALVQLTVMLSSRLVDFIDVDLVLESRAQSLLEAIKELM